MGRALGLFTFLKGIFLGNTIASEEIRFKQPKTFLRIWNSLNIYKFSVFIQKRPIN